MRALRFAAASALLAGLALAASARAPAPFPKTERSTRLPVGKWTVTFANGVVETCEVRGDGVAHVSEQLRASPGKATVKGNAVIVRCDDDRIERWSRVNGRMVVEHWFPSVNYPAGTPVRGEAKPAW